MPDFSAFVPETHQNISPGYVETLIQTQRQELSTGLLRLSYPSGENLIFTFLEGIQQRLYRCFENGIEVVPRHSWLDALNHSSRSAGFLSVPVEAMRFIRIAHESSVNRVEQSTLSFENLVTYTKKWAVAPEPGIVHVQAQGIKKYYLIAGNSTPIIEELSFADSQVRFNIVDASFPAALPNVDYQVTRYVSSRQHEFWREYELRLAFTPFMRMLLNRFSELAGRVLTERLCLYLSTWAQANGWNIRVTGNGVVNRHYFESLESAIGVYVNLLRRFHEEASPALGWRMAENISRETLAKLDPYRRELLTKYVYDGYGVANAVGTVWR